MRFIFSICLLVLAAPSLLAQETKPNTLTPKEIAEGWILLFDGESDFGWTIQGDHKVVGKSLILGGKDKTVARSNTKFHNFSLTLAFRNEGEAEMRWGDRKHSFRGRGNGTINATFDDEPNQLLFEVPSGSTLQIDKLAVQPVAKKSIFNGKDLTGWKVFPGKKSVFTVEDGAIQIKDGPGDLQTEGKYKDFILQLECKSNGKHLNSGVFFRCREGEYQNGYEAQIRNQFTPEPTQEYTIDEYDPQTHKLIGKNKIKSTAVDYGTGAIYRRVPARKEMAKDGEWFTLTIVAHGNHIATWVNGVQVVDWFDNRPPSDNARTGCKTEAGHISFQGHDPTTNLSFRNIRIAELPK